MIYRSIRYFVLCFLAVVAGLGLNIEASERKKLKAAIIQFTIETQTPCILDKNFQGAGKNFQKGKEKIADEDLFDKVSHKRKRMPTRRAVRSAQDKKYAHDLQKALDKEANQRRVPSNKRRRVLGITDPNSSTMKKGLARAGLNFLSSQKGTLQLLNAAAECEAEGGFELLNVRYKMEQLWSAACQSDTEYNSEEIVAPPLSDFTTEEEKSQEDLPLNEGDLSELQEMPEPVDREDVDAPDFISADNSDTAVAKELLQKMYSQLLAASNKSTSKEDSFNFPIIVSDFNYYEEEVGDPLLCKNSKIV